MRARITDPLGPPVRRAALPLLALMAMGAAAFAPMNTSAHVVLFCVGLALFYAAPLLLRRRAPYDATLQLAPGCVRVRGRLADSFRIYARELTAASTARVLGGGVILAIASNRRRNRPMVLELADDASARRVCDALGVGHRGFGRLKWPTERRALDQFMDVVRGFAAACALVLTLAPFSEPLSAFAGILVMALAFCSLMTFVVWLGSPLEDSAVVLEPGWVALMVRGVVRRLPYAMIRGVFAEPGSIVIDAERGPPVLVPARPRVGWPGSPYGLSEEERGYVVAQIESAARRARGEGAPPPVVHARVADLAVHPPAYADGARAWLERLDATGRMLAQGGYRGAGIEESDLWATLENHDADVESRVAAARVLLRVSPATARVRASEVMATLRDENARARMQAALIPDVEDASQTLAELERRG